MQNRYAGNIGDFAKYGLLRAVRGRKRLGVAWYLHPDAGPESDGGRKAIAYLRQPEEWRRLDPELLEAMKNLVDNGLRSVEEVRKSGILGDAVLAAQPLDIAGVRIRDRAQWRRRWFERVRERLSGCDLVFADPDNGLFPDHCFEPTRKEHAKRIPLAEAQALAKGRTAVIYHHNTRSRGTHDEEIRWWMDQLPGCTCAWYWRRWSNRTFFIIHPDAEMECLLKRFAKRWTGCGRLIPKDP